MKRNKQKLPNFAKIITSYFISAMTYFSVFATASAAPPTVEEYLKIAGDRAKVVAAGKLVISGKRLTCGRRPTVIHPGFSDYGGAFPGFLILNIERMKLLPKVVQWWIFAHECAHQFRGPSEETADCFAVQRGRRQGWLKETGMEQICKFIAPARGDGIHSPGPVRCEKMRICFASKKVF